VIRAVGGIRFGSDTAAANTLRDYEEGTWTPTFSGGMTVTGGTINASYVKIGKVVTLNLTFENVTIANAAASTPIGGLPYTVSKRCCSAIMHHAMFNETAPVFFLEQGTKTAFVYKNVASAGGSAWVGVAAINRAGVYFNTVITYITSD
jgi:hypothetical protein